MDSAEEIKTISPEEMWERFINHLNQVQPIGKPDKDGKTLPHQNFIGSVSSYRKIFLESARNK